VKSTRKRAPLVGASAGKIARLIPHVDNFADLNELRKRIDERREILRASIDAATSAKIFEDLKVAGIGSFWKVHPAFAVHHAMRVGRRYRVHTIKPTGRRHIGVWFALDPNDPGAQPALVWMPRDRMKDVVPFDAADETPEGVRARGIAAAGEATMRRILGG